MRIAIDGPAGSGKSTVTRIVAKNLGFTYLDTGAMYRAVTLACLDGGVDLDNSDLVADVANSIKISFGHAKSENDAIPVFLDGRDVTKEIRSSRVDSNVSKVAAISEVRRAMVGAQRELAKSDNVCAEGRDIGTQVFPDAELKIFLIADACERALRRTKERIGHDPFADDASDEDKAIYNSIYDDILKRDKLDESRADSPLKPAADAVMLDSTKLTPDEVVAEIERLAHEKLACEKPAKAKHKDKMKPFRGNDFSEFYEHGIKEFPWTTRNFYGFICRICYLFAKLYWPTSFKNIESAVSKLKSRDEGTVIIMNHVSMLEPVLTAIIFYHYGLIVRPIFKQEFNKNNFMRWAFTRIGGIPVNRGESDMKALRRAKAAIKRGENVLIYPEGTRIREDIDAPIHGGFAIIAQMAKTDILPCAVVGVRAVTPEGKKLARPRKVWMACGDFISFDDIDAKGRSEKLKRMEEVSMNEVWRLRQELRDEHPGEW